MNVEEIKQKYLGDAYEGGWSYYDLMSALRTGDIKPTQRMVASGIGGMAKTAKEWLDMGPKLVNYYKPYPLDSLRLRRKQQKKLAENPYAVNKDLQRNWLK